MEKPSLTELACAIRMTSSGHDVPGKNSRQPFIVMFDDSDRAIECSRSRGTVAGLAEKLNLRPVLDFSENVAPREVADTIGNAIDSHGAVPNIVVVENRGIFTVGRNKREALRFNMFLLDKKKYHAATEQEETLHLRLPGHVAIVTGSAQGFGKGIAQELAREGAHVIIADLNKSAGVETQDEINRQLGPDVALFCDIDVTSPPSIEQCIEQTVRAFGGVDLFISNAGVLKAGALHEMDDASFDLVTKINYTAYFLCTKAIARIMKLQHEYNKHHVMDIVQVNSKSGLQGSNKNFAYAGSKFGSIGLTQSFALELIEYNIKVNAICPGNYYEGPLWSDPKNGLFVQYLKAGKVPGAKTIDDVKQLYLSKSPIRRGCLPRDVAVAILYAHEQQYETGQAIPVTGGQVMLK
jgi:NAD(P)-dependent dehydrogenase (short-subunit alcohol dehydrogenase family)